MEEKKEILRRVYLIYILCCVFALAVISRVCYIQFVQGDYWKKEAENFMIRELDIEAVRGNIFAADGSLLATSLPYYEIAIDPHVNDLVIDDVMFEDSAYALSQKLASLLPAKTADEYFRMMISARKNDLGYQLLAKNVSYQQLQEIKKFPLFRLGRYKGGLIYVQTNRRERPFRMLASRTIGYISDSGRVKVGLEGAYDSVLTGISGKRLMRKIAGGVWMPLNNENEIEPQHGKDIVTTIDINIQDVAENALLHSLAEHNAKYGCVVLMEVQTGEIRAIANLTRKDSGTYVEDFNYAIADAREPGSTFKLASYLVAMDDGLLSLNDHVNLNGGEYKYFDRVMHDSHDPKENDVTAEEAFWESSNVGISRLITQAYGKEPRKFTDGLHRLRFGEPLGLSIKGEGKSKIKNAGDKDWSGVSLPWISIGYESQVTPLQTLTLYNAVANNGVMVKPTFVREILDKGKTVHHFQPEILNPSIAKPETIKNARRLLEGVVQNGTAKSMKNSVYKVAGKTGTAQVANDKGRYKSEGFVTYQASFVGYFPADAPRYSCIVVVNAPSNDVYYGGLVAGPIFKQIADRVFATELDIHDPVNNSTVSANEAPSVKYGLLRPTLAAADLLHQNIGGKGTTANASYVKVDNTDNKLQAHAEDPENILKSGIMPDLRGMTGSDALFILENNNVRVRLRGAGSVIRQSIAPGTKIPATREVILDLTV